MKILFLSLSVCIIMAILDTTCCVCHFLNVVRLLINLNYRYCFNYNATRCLETYAPFKPTNALFITYSREVFI